MSMLTMALPSLRLFCPLSELPSKCILSQKEWFTRYWATGRRGSSCTSITNHKDDPRFNRLWTSYLRLSFFYFDKYSLLMKVLLPWRVVMDDAFSHGNKNEWRFLQMNSVVSRIKRRFHRKDGLISSWIITMVASCKEQLLEDTDFQESKMVLLLILLLVSFLSGSLGFFIFTFIFRLFSFAIVVLTWETID